MRALELKERSLTVSTSQVSGEIKKTKLELSNIHQQKKVFMERFESHLRQSKSSPLNSPEVIQSLVNLKNRLSSISRKQNLTTDQISNLIAKYEMLNTQARKIADKSNALLAIEKEKKASSEMDATLELQGVIKSINDQSSIATFAKSKAELSPIISNQINAQSITSEISVSVKRGDGVNALLHVSLEPLGGISATVQTSTASFQERNELEKRMKRALRDHKDKSGIQINFEDS